MNDIFNSTRFVKVVAQANGKGARYSIVVNKKEIHHFEDSNPPSANRRIAYYQTARLTLSRHLTKMQVDAETICQELQISIMLATD